MGWAQRHLDDLRAALAECAAIPVMGNPDDIAALTTVETEAAGDGSLLLTERPAGRATLVFALTPLGGAVPLWVLDQVLPSQLVRQLVASRAPRPRPGPSGDFLRAGGASSRAPLTRFAESVETSRRQ